MSCKLFDLKQRKSSLDSLHGLVEHQAELADLLSERALPVKMHQGRHRSKGKLLEAFCYAKYVSAESVIKGGESNARV